MLMEPVTEEEMNVSKPAGLVWCLQSAGDGKEEAQEQNMLKTFILVVKGVRTPGASPKLFQEHFEEHNKESKEKISIL